MKKTKNKKKKNKQKIKVFACICFFSKQVLFLKAYDNNKLTSQISFN